MVDSEYFKKYYQENKERYFDRYNKKREESEYITKRRNKIQQIKDKFGAKVDRDTSFSLFEHYGWTYKDGNLYSHKNKIWKHRVAKIYYNEIPYSISAGQLIYFLQTGTIQPKFTKSENVKRSVKRSKKISIVNKKITKNYIINTELLYEVKISQGKGVISDKLFNMLYKIVSNIARKFYYKDEDLKYDVINEAYLNMLKQVNSYNTEKYSNAFAYFSELGKRGLAFNHKKIHNKGLSGHYSQMNLIRSISLTNFD